MRKRQTTAVRLSSGKVRVFVKGGPDVVLPFCSKMIDAKGNPVDLNEDEKNNILGEKVLKKFASKCYRTLLVAYVDYTQADWENLK
jgi:magnesium-transporting ATPase (P-type)